MYGLNNETTESFGKRCLMAKAGGEGRALRAVIHSQPILGQPHRSPGRPPEERARNDQPIAALLKDLKQRGLLDSTLVVWMGEFGRTPDNLAEQRKQAGRDHNTRAMTIWFAGGGTKGGTLVGATDDIGFKAVQDIYKIRDVHATILSLMGLNDMRLTYYHAGRNMRLTDTGGRVISQVVA
jgi:hypothetical protein